MKTVIEQNGWRDIIITSDISVIKINNGKDVDYTNEKDGIARHKRFVKELVMYEDEWVDGGRTGNAKRVNLNIDQILRLADKIREINSETFNEIYVPDDDLPW